MGKSNKTRIHMLKPTCPLSPDPFPYLEPLPPALFLPGINLANLVSYLRFIPRRFIPGIDLDNLKWWLGTNDERERCIETYHRYAVPCCGHCHACSIVMSRVPMDLKCGSHQRWEALVRGGSDAGLEAPTRRS